MANHLAKMAFLLVLAQLGAKAFSRTRFPGPYCATRTPEKCCLGRQDTCTVPIHDTLCYCDEFCFKHSVEDCCPDYEPVCQGKEDDKPIPLPPSPENLCTSGSTVFNIGDKTRLNCNDCECIRDNQDVLRWKCENDLCLNNDILIQSINSQQQRAGYRAKRYSKFDGIKLRDGFGYFLGTIYPKQEVVRLHPLNAREDEVFEREFDSAKAWPSNYIHPAMDQGRCGASWAFSTASVASDRWSIQSQGAQVEQLSPQNLLSCNTQVLGCEGGRVEDAWWYVMSQGVVEDKCYPYTSGLSRVKESCKYTDEITCPSGERARVRRTTPAYRVAQNEREIMNEIKKQGPVQAILKVKPDFFLYERGIYKHTGVLSSSHADSNINGTHSVKITGWGEENGQKYWKCVNSWGREWGEDGTFRILRGENESGIEEFVIAVWPRVERLRSQGRTIKIRHRL